MRFSCGHSMRQSYFENLVFVEGGKPEDLEKDLRSQDENQQQTQPTRDTWETNLGHNVGSRALSPLRHPGSSRKKQNFELIVYVTTAIKFVLQILTSAFMESMTVSTNRQTVLIRLDRTTVFVKMVTRAMEKPFARQRVSGLAAQKL